MIQRVKAISEELTITGCMIGFETKLLKKNPGWKILVFFHSSG
jgi:hypothetical protein